ncbi:hypothetical protein [Streptomyces sp. NPDC001389]
MPASAEELRVMAREWHAKADFAEVLGNPDLARVCRREATACEKAADQTR